MLCPICGKELPEKARKCDKCGCRPKYLYGRPKMPKWVVPAAALALVVCIVVVCLVFWLTQEEKYEVSLLSSSTDYVSRTQYYYDSKGNLEKVTCVPKTLSSGITGLLIPYIQAQFYYDENGVFTKVDMTSGVRSWEGIVEYDEAAGTVAIRLASKDLLSTRYLFQYGQNGRLEEYINGQTDKSKTELKYDETGKLLSYTSLYRPAGGTWSENYKDTLEYDADGKVTAYVRQLLSSSSEFTYFCGTDQWGNVLEVEDLGRSHQYLDRRVVTATMLRQYELQLHLLNMMGLSPNAIVFPVMKTPC